MTSRLDPSVWRPSLSRGMQGPDVASWQRVLFDEGILARESDIDGDFGAQTEKKTILFQLRHGLPPVGVVGPKTRAEIGVPKAPPTLPQGIFDQRWAFLQAANFTRMTSHRAVNLIVLHTMEAPERPDTAEGVASWFAGARGNAPQASAHVCCDMDSIVQCVLPNDIAWAAKGGNSSAYHCEQAGYAKWPREKWLEPNSLAMLTLMASHLRLALDHFLLPAKMLSDDEVAHCIRDSLIRNGKFGNLNLSGVVGGVCQHRQITRVWQAWNRYALPNPRLSPTPWWPTHVDCGDGYPSDVLLDLAKEAV